MAEWTTLRQLQPGAVFRTKAEILAVKSEYRYSYGQGQSECILCASGEYAHFPRANETEVQEIPLALIEAAPDLLEACEMVEFIQIGERAFNPRLVTMIWFNETRHEVTLWFAAEIEPLTLCGTDYDTFMRWWERKADVHKVV